MSLRAVKRPLVIVAVALAAAAPVSAGKQAPSRVLATADDTPAYTLVLSRPKVVPGPSIIQFANAGEDAHDLKIKRVGASKSRQVGDLEPGQTANLSIGHLRKGSRYRLWCTLKNHASFGMEAYLKVKKHR